jgi:hypothetical protein
MAATRTRAAGFVAKALANTAPERRRALLVEMMGHTAQALAGILGSRGAAEEAFRLADEMATRGKV